MGEITLNHITKIEGHARLDLEVENGKLIKCHLGSIEGSRYFEGLLKGRRYDDGPEISSRICGICSSAHGVAAVMAMENALGILPSEQTVILRELQTIGERFRSHSTHLHFLVLPDYLGYESALAMAPKYNNELQRALRIVKLGNDMISLVSGRIMHQVATQVGHFGHLPTQADLEDLKKRLIDAKEDVMKIVELFASLKVPEVQTTDLFFSLADDHKYAVSHGYIKVGNQRFEQKDYAKLLKEYHEPYSNANFVVKDGKAYCPGALARLHNNEKFISHEAREAMKKVGFTLPCHNSFMNNLAQAIELVHYREECIKILDSFKVKREEIKEIKPRAGHGIAANEAPRGTLWHEYTLDESGIITFANVVTPTAQYLRNMQDDLAKYVQILLDRSAPKEEITLEAEKLIRSYDPCFSCATHFLQIAWHEK